ncbi:hypothetical protein KUTeg_017490 [Tegillarca granosa]|uniref:SH2 domain-containing protein n=1 Tax=Tegillarca granosa TaxID=220873 RepID=A0ABQ9EF28_TEGGR|nr:hypothetical protein KUTeg_017490 [Tegillarca granosa]
MNYTDLWLVLKDSVIYIFTDSTVGKDTHIGKLTIDRYTEVHKRGGDDKSGYKFELFTGYGQTRKKNKFKSSKKVYMEMWRGYLEGLAVGTVPNDLDLLPDQVSQIQSDIDYFRNRPKSEPSLRSGNSGNARNRMSAADSGINVDGASMTTRSSGKTLGGGSDGGPTTRHKFTNDHDYVSDQTPSWFFENCSRQQAETILTIGKDYGNTLMRMSSTHKDHGSYVISKMFRKENRFEHFEVLRVANGYKINVENQHNAMSNLTEVMKFFVRTAGQHDTFPMKSNRMVDYGMKEEPDYATKFYNTQPESARESVNFKLASSEPEEPLPDYEEPVPRPNKTFTPGILKKEGSKYYHRQGSTGEAGSAQSNHVPYSTVSHGNRNRLHQRSSVPPQQDFEKRVVTAAHLQHLDDVIGQFEPPAKEEEYVNQDFFNQARTGHFVNQPSRQQESQSPPLPSPHTPSTHSYNKEDNRSVLSMPLPPTPAPVQVPEPPPPPPPPPAPPAPPINNNDPRVKNLRSKSVLNVAEQINQMKLKPARTDLTKTVTGDLPASVLRESQRVKSVQSSYPNEAKKFCFF